MKSKETEMAIKGLSSLKLCNSTAIMDLYHKFITYGRNLTNLLIIEKMFIFGTFDWNHRCTFIFIGTTVRNDITLQFEQMLKS